MGDIELLVPRSRKGKFPTKLLERYARRCHSVDQVLLACFCLGLSTRKAASVLAPVLKEKVSASTISRIAQGLNQEVDRYHSRRLQDRYKYLFFDGVVLKSKSEIRVVWFGVRSCNHTLTYLPQILDLKIVEHVAIPEAAAYPPQLKGDLWVATDTQFYIAGWNTNLVKKGDEPKSYEELANPKWKDNIMGEPRDYQMLVGFAKRKFNSDEKAIDLFKKIAANQVEFHRGHSQLTEFLMAGQRAICFTCYSHHFPVRMKKGAPIQPLMTEGVGEVGGSVMVMKGAPHPNAALLWVRWVVSEEGQKAYAQAGETPAHPKVEPLEKIRPTTPYMLTIDDVREFPKYEKTWKEIFQIR